MVRISHVKSNSPCIFLGDFNAIRYRQEKVGGSSVWSNENEEFNTYINSSDLTDLSYGGCQFTWANKRADGDYIATKIDRVLVNEDWLVKYPESSASFLPSGISDHSPAVVNISETKTSFKKPFKYFDFWSKHPDFLNCVSATWDQFIRGVPMFRVCQKLKQLKTALKLLNKKDYNMFYTNLFGSPFANQYNGLDRIKSLVKTKVSVSQYAMLAMPISDAEIKDVFWSLKPNKAPGPDG
ncbi:uncharacterized protein LOC114315081 [Camellia sinensis]|uniref:uncharacterized protein LOC114315081 n=1 Tax=Camellia sinensis TaxID=4442 RepID=UPI0010355228|nr:uncharacterized protein LOC114315081 [Camellia sinensis]